jgi:hypothetical protein
MNTITGLPPDGNADLGVNTLTARQSSSPVGAPDERPICGQTGAYVLAVTVAAGQVGGCGDFHRLAPVAGAANRMPRNDQLLPRSLPW